MLLGILLTLPKVQTKLGTFATQKLNEKFKTDINIGKVHISPFGKVKLKEVLIKDHHKDTLFHIGALNTSVLSFSKLVNDGHPYLGDLFANDLYVNIYTYKNEDFSNLDKFIDAFDDGSPSTGKFRMKANSITINNGRFAFSNENKETKTFLDVNNLNGKVYDFFIKGSDVTTYIEKLSFVHQNGLVLDNLSAYFTYTKQNLILDKLQIQTPNSNINGNLKLLYKKEDFANFTDKVVFSGNLSKSEIGTNDINYFYNEFSKDNIFYVTSSFNGTLNNLTLSDLELLDKNNSEVIGTVTFKNVIDGKNDSYNIIGNFNKIATNYNKLAYIMPNVIGKRLPKELKKFGNVNFNGDLDLTENNLVTNFNLLSQLGEIESNIELSGLKNIDNAAYKGNVTLYDFNVGNLLNDKTLGKTTLDIDVNGKGFTKKNLKTILKGNVQSFYYNGYTYKNIDIDGNLKMPYFKGYLKSNDANAKLEFDGLVDLSQKSNQYDFRTNIDYLNLNKLGILPKNKQGILKGNIVAKAYGNSIDNLAGTLSVNKLSFENEKDNYYFEDFNITSNFDDEGVRTINLNSPDIISGTIVGKYKINQVQKIVENAVGSLYANYKPNPLAPNQFLDFDLTIYSKAIEIFLPEVKIAENTKVKGKINADKGEFKLDFSSPFIDAYSNKISNLNIEINNKNPLYNTYITLDSLRTKNYKISDFNLLNLTLNDTLYVRSEFKGGNAQQDNFDLNIFHTINQEKQSVVGFKKSEISFKNYQWYINEQETKDNKIVFDKNFKDFDFQKIILSHNNQYLEFFGNMKDSTYKDLNLNFKDVALEKITPSLDSLTFGGKLNGNISYQQNKNLHKPQSEINIENLSMNNLLIGDLYLNIIGNENLQKFSLNAEVSQDNQKRLSATGFINYINKATTIDIDAQLNKFNLAPFSYFLRSVLSDVRGNATGQIIAKGNIEDPNIDGRLYLNDAGMRIPYLNVDYALEKNAIIDLTEHQFALRKIRVTDTKYNTTGVIDGNIRHKKLGNWIIDLNLSSQNILALDTQDSEDALYYGTAFMKGNANITGPINALEIIVKGESEPGTFIKLPIDSSGDVGNNSFITFISPEEKYGKGKITKSLQYNGIELDLDFDIDTDAEIEIILDRSTGHAMSGRGYGSIQMEINTEGKFLMTGDFLIYEGEYNFKYAGLIDKKFIVKRGGTIRWDGDPMNAILNLEAIYKTTANPAVLLESASFNRKVPTEVSILLNGNLSNPVPDFSIDFPTVSSVLKNEIEYRLQNKDARQTQAFALLATGSFFTPETASNTVYGPLFERASSLFNDLFSDEDSKLQLGVDYTQGDRINAISDRVGVTLNTQINDRISINGKVGVPVGGITESVIVGDVEIQLQLNEDGSLKAHVFNRENDVNYIAETIGYTQGIGLNYSVEFDDFKELIKKIFNNNKNKKTSNSNFSDQMSDSEISPDFINLIQDAKNKKGEIKQEEPIEIIEED